MEISVILAHPRNGSFNHAIAGAVIDVLKANNHEVIFHDLYEENFDPVLAADEIPKSASLSPAVGQHCTEISRADGIVIVHPNWWGQPPAILKGWIDRIIRPGTAYEFIEGDSGEGVPCGLLKATTALIFNTSNTHEERERNVFGDPLERIWRDCVFGLCGIKNVYRKMFGVIVTSTPLQRERWLGEVRQMVSKHFPHS